MNKLFMSIGNRLLKWWGRPFGVSNRFKFVDLWNVNGKEPITKLVPKKRPPTRIHSGWILDNYTTYMWEDEETSVKNGDTPRAIGGRNIPAVRI